MSTLTYDISISVDGYVRAADPTTEEPLGIGGEALHEWALGEDPGGSDLLEQAVAGHGAVICGRRTYDDSMPWWGTDGPTGSRRLPVFVVTHDPPTDAPEGGVYEFVSTGIEDALSLARQAAGEKDVSLMGGPALANQYLRVGLVDELSLHVSPVLFGSGTPLTEELPAHIALEPRGQTTTARATHLRYGITS